MSTTDKLFGLEPYVYDENEIIHEHDFDMKLLSEVFLPSKMKMEMMSAASLKYIRKMAR